MKYMSQKRYAKLAGEAQGLAERDNKSYATRMIRDDANSYLMSFLRDIAKKNPLDLSDDNVIGKYVVVSRSVNGGTSRYPDYYYCAFASLRIVRATNCYFIDEWGQRFDKESILMIVRGGATWID